MRLNQAVQGQAVESAMPPSWQPILAAAGVSPEIRAAVLEATNTIIGEVRSISTCCVFRETKSAHDGDEVRLR